MGRRRPKVIIQQSNFCMLTLFISDPTDSDPGSTEVAGLTDPDLLFAAEGRALSIARNLYAPVKDLPIVSPHGHTDPRWYALNEPFPDPAQLLVVPDHYIFRMLFSQGVRLEDLGVPALDGAPLAIDGRAIWRC